MFPLSIYAFFFHLKKVLLNFFIKLYIVPQLTKLLFVYFFLFYYLKKITRS